jgi:hypothetical protein
LLADGERATAGNGSMVALAFRTPAEVAAVHALVVLGGADEGAPDLRAAASISPRSSATATATSSTRSASSSVTPGVSQHVPTAPVLPAGAAREKT